MSAVEAPERPALRVPDVCAALADALGRAPHEVGPDTRLGALVSDSLGVLLLGAWLEEHGVRVDDASAVEAWSPRDLAGRLTRLSAPARGERSLRERCEKLVTLRPLRGADQWQLLDLALGEAAPAWLAGPAGSAEPDAVGALLARSLTSRVITPTKAPGEMLGHVMAYDADSRSGTVKLAAALRDPLQWPGMGAAACLRFADELFRGWPLRKIVLETPAPIAETFLDELALWCSLEGRLAAHVWMDGDHHDLLLWTCTREQCAQLLSDPPGILLARRSAGLRRSGTAPAPAETTQTNPEEQS
jgi:hypothetical protein